MKKEKTIFEKIIDREVPADILYEDEKNIVILDIFPFEKGHILIIPKKRYETVWEMPEDEFLDLSKIILKFSKKIRENMNCGLNIHQNNLAIAQQVVPHVHFHLVPRKQDILIYQKNEGKNIYTSDEERKKITDLLKID